jgi:hypothetical protein
MSQRTLYHHLTRNEIIKRDDELNKFMNMSHDKKKKFLQALYRNDNMKDFNYYTNKWKQLKSVA